MVSPDVDAQVIKFPVNVVEVTLATKTDAGIWIVVSTVSIPVASGRYLILTIKLLPTGHGLVAGDTARNCGVICVIVTTFAGDHPVISVTTCIAVPAFFAAILN